MVGGEKKERKNFYFLFLYYFLPNLSLPLKGKKRGKKKRYLIFYLILFKKLNKTFFQKHSKETSFFLCFPILSPSLSSSFSFFFSNLFLCSLHSFHGTPTTPVKHKRCACMPREILYLQLNCLPENFLC